MRADELAEKLISAKDETQRKRLLAENANLANENLALALKEICYTAWTTEPTKAQRAAKALQSLVKSNPSDEIKAMAFWVAGIARITEGKLDSASKNLEKSAAFYYKIKREHEAAQTQVARLYALALLGKYDEAAETGEQAVKIFKKYGDELARGKVEKNLGNIAARQGDELGAEKYYLAARRRFLKINNVEELTMAENSLANTYTELNDFRKAEKFYSQALSRAKEAKMLVTEAEIQASIGNHVLFRGKLDQALRFLELSRQKYEILQMPHQTAIAELEIADIYLELNLTEEAFSIYEKVSETLHKLKLQGEEARARANFGRVATLRDEIKTARRQLKKAAKLFEREKNKIGAARVKLNQASLELAQKNYKTALQTAKDAENLLAQSGYLRHILTAQWLRAEALRNLGKNAEAENLLQKVFADSARNEQPNTAQSAQISMGKIAFGQKNYRKAEKHFKRAITMIETLREPLPAEEFRMAFLADKLAPFENLAKIYLAENKIKRAFLTFEKARARSLAESMNRNSEISKNSEADGKLQKKLSNLREELNWFYSRLNRAENNDVENLEIEARTREKQIADLMRQISGTRLRDADASRSVFFSKNEAAYFQQLQTRIGKQKALIEFVIFKGNFSAFVVTGEKIHFIADLAAESEILSLLEGLQFQFGALRYGAKNLGAFAGELKKRADFYLQKLFTKLFQPLEKFVVNRDLIVVPVGALHYVPFQALFDGQNYLIEAREIVYSPSASVWQFLASKTRQKSENALLIGYADERIPLVAREIEILKKNFGRAKTFTGARARISAFLKNAPLFDVLHIACHGQFRPENPMFSSLNLSDGRLTVRDICSLSLKAELVTLSACETGLNKIFAGEEILGLARGFLSAGAHSLVLSLWTVNDKATAELMQDFYAHRKTGKSAAESLRIAQRGFIRQNAHPYFWSPFVLIGA